MVSFDQVPEHGYVVSSVETPRTRPGMKFDAFAPHLIDINRCS